MVYIVKSADTEDGRMFIEEVAHSFARAELGHEQVAFDCEGINLSRIGTVELISICFSSLKVFLIDFGGTSDRTIQEQVKRLFESNEIIKIIHDCRMDSDALFHRHGISLKNVHDTSCFIMSFLVNKTRVSMMFLFTIASLATLIATRVFMGETRIFGQIAL